MDGYRLVEKIDKFLKEIPRLELSGDSSARKKVGVAFVAEVEKLLADTKGNVDPVAIHVCKNMKFADRKRLLLTIESLRTKDQIVFPDVVAALWHQIEEIGQPEQLVETMKKHLQTAIEAEQAAQRELATRTSDIIIAKKDLQDAEQALAKHVEGEKAAKLAAIEAEEKDLMAKLAALAERKKGI